MHRPHTTSKHFIDALGAFWPGLQVLMGDLKPAIESHEILYQIMQRHNFIPEVNIQKNIYTESISCKSENVITIVLL